MSAIYTIGYGSREIAEFLRLLKAYSIEYLVDVRSVPFSRYKPDFSQKQLDRHLNQANITYVFMGHQLGGQPKDASLYTRGKANYDLIKASKPYLEGIVRLQTALDKSLKLALMCSEGRPEDCHRSKLIGESLAELGVDVLHIDENGQLKSHATVIQSLVGIQLSFLNPSFTSRKRYTTGE